MKMQTMRVNRLSIPMISFFFACSFGQTPPDSNPIETAFFIPTELKGTLQGDTYLFTLELQKGSMEFLKGKKTETWGFNGDFLGPTIRVKRGKKVEFHVKNSIGETSTVHWHGLHIPAKMDGGPHQTIAAGDTWKPSFTIMQRASTNWYHPHLEGKTGPHVYMGLAGMFIIEDELSEKLDLPHTYGVDDIPIIIQDRNFNEDGSFKYIYGDMERMVGVKGKSVLINGVIMPRLEAPMQLVRLRMLNGSNARMYNIGLENNRTFYQIATEGGLLEKPVELTRLLLSPGERAEILIDLRNEKMRTLKLMSYSSETTKILDKFDVNGGMHADKMDQTDYALMTILVSKDAIKNYELPAELAKVERFNEADAMNTRTFELNIKGEMGSKQDFLINDKKMMMHRIDETVQLNSTEIWTLKNISEMPHPFHIHGVSFLVLDRNGKTVGKHEKGWKDTVLVGFDETVRVIIKFENFADPDSPYMYHCHILEHEDDGMMGQFVVVP